jgi:dihydroorotase-like cyclic amidohydrolase
MTELLIKNGFVFDPLNGINGERMDIAIKNSKIVDKINLNKAKKIDATGLTVMPGGVDELDSVWCGAFGSVDFRDWLPLFEDGLHYDNEPFHAAVGSEAHA